MINQITFILGEETDFSNNIYNAMEKSVESQIIVKDDN